MFASSFHFGQKIPAPVRYWLAWALLLAALALAMHRYLDYRNRALDRRIEQLDR